MKSEILSRIDHTLLKASATKKQIEKLCEEAEAFGFASVCVNPCFVEFAAKKLLNSPVKVCTVISFPLGSDSPEDKATAAKNAVLRGADEIDVVQNTGLALSGDFDAIENEIKGVVRESKNAGREIGKENIIVKVILETCCLTDAQIIESSRAAKNAGADFVKTSTGFGTGGATAHHVKIMRETVGNEMGVKASGGIKNLSDAKKMIEAGATRIGTSSGCSIASELS